MIRKWNMAAVLLLVAVLFSGCDFRTVDQMYAVPKRSAEYQDLQRAIDVAMVGLEYCAPLSGENQQTVQMADLTGDGNDEYVLFAKGTTDDPLKIFVFTRNGKQFHLIETIESRGSGFELVEYVDVDGVAGKEMVVGLRVSDQVLRYLCVYSFSAGEAQQLMASNYTKFVVTDMNQDEKTDILVITPGGSDEDNAVAVVYHDQNGVMSRSVEANLSSKADRIKRIMVSPIQGLIPAVYVASAVEENALITDVFSIIDGNLTNVSASNESGTSIKTLRNHYVYACDINDDGILELPCLMDMVPVQNPTLGPTQHLIRWYAMTIDGGELDSMYTFHDLDGGWYLTLNDAWAPRISVVQETGTHTFYVWNENFEKAEKLLTLYSLTGADRNLDPNSEDLTELYKTDGVTYAARLEIAALSYGLTLDNLLNDFHLIHMDWKSGVT